MSATTFKQKSSLEKRIETSLSLKKKYPDKLPIIVEQASTAASRDLPTLDKHKFLVPTALTVGQFIYVIRRRMQLPAETAMFIYIQNILPPTASSLSLIYDEYKDEDGFLYVTYSGENTFG
jgi:GABA(A) receptor-associated protein